jgi:hypothetical protein
MENKTVSLFVGLAKAQASFNSAIKDTKNSFFKSNYADLSAVWDACKDAIKENGLIVLQPTAFHEPSGEWVVNTRIYDQTGQFIEGNTPIKASKQNDPQAFGSATTYARRYGLAALLGIVTEDDDAEGAMSRDNNKKASTPVKEEKPVLDIIKLQAEYRNLLSNPVIEEHEQKQGLLKINTFSEQALASKIAKLKEIIEERTKKAA